MANFVAAQTGNWDTGSTWVGGVSPPYTGVSTYEIPVGITVTVNHTGFPSINTGPNGIKGIVSMDGQPDFNGGLVVVKSGGLIHCTNSSSFINGTHVICEAGGNVYMGGACRVGGNALVDIYGSMVLIGTFAESIGGTVNTHLESGVVNVYTGGSVTAYGNSEISAGDGAVVVNLNGGSFTFRDTSKLASGIFNVNAGGQLLMKDHSEILNLYSSQPEDPVTIFAGGSLSFTEFASVQFDETPDGYVNVPRITVKQGGTYVNTTGIAAAVQLENPVNALITTYPYKLAPDGSLLRANVSPGPTMNAYLAGAR